MVVEAARFRITGDNSDYTNSLSDAEKKTDSFRDSVVANFREGVTGAGVAAFTAIAASAAAATAAYAVQAEAIDDLAKQSTRLAVPIERLEALRLAAELSGVSVQSMDRALRDVAIRTSRAAKGTGEAATAIRQLGLRAQDLAKLRPDQLMITYAEAIAKLENQTDKARITTDLFGESAVELLALFADGSDGIAGAIELVDDYGLSLSRVDARRVEQANDAIAIASKKSVAFARQAVVAFAPVVTAVADVFTKSTGRADKFRMVMEDVATTAANVMDDVKLTAEITKGSLELVLSEYLRFLSSSVIRTTKVLDFLTSVPRKILGFFGVDVSAARSATELFGNALSGTADELERASKKTIAQALANREVFKTALEAARAQAELGGQADAAPQAPVAIEDPKIAEMREKELAREAERREAALERLERSFFDEQELLAASLNTRLELIQEFEDAKILSQERGNELRVASVRDAEAQIAALERKAALQSIRTEAATSNQRIKIAKGVGNLLTAIATGVAAKNEAIAKAAFIVEKAIAIAQTIVQTQVASTRALAELGPIAGPPAAAAIQVAGGLAVAAIVATAVGGLASPGGGGAGSINIPETSTRSSTPFEGTPAQTAADLPDDRLGAEEITVQVLTFSDDEVDTLIDRLATGVRERDRVFIDPNTRQASLIGGT